MDTIIGPYGNKPFGQSVYHLSLLSCLCMHDVCHLRFTSLNSHPVFKT